MMWTEAQLKVEHAYRYNEFLGNLEVWGIPTSEQHNAAVVSANSTIAELRKQTGIVAMLRELRESL